MIYNVLSLGAGVQSSTIALMAAHEIIKPMPDFGVFADTQNEPEKVYEWLNLLKTKLPFPIVTISKGNLGQDSMKIKISKSGKRRLDLGIPLFTQFQSRTVMLNRQCTKHYKVMAVARAIRERLGVKVVPKKMRVIQWIGISVDEAHRMKPSQIKWIENRYPLIDLLMSRSDCLKWLTSQGYPEPPKSACYFCPYNSNYKWQKMKTEDPDSFEKAVQWERMINEKRLATDFLKAPVNIHPSLLPLDQVAFTNEAQMDLFKGNSFGNECEGMCGI